ncbi:MAG: S41 family peptidase [Flavobacteriales bacterium]|nr:S41 family peptidase [Flavobacteriales bacterium]MCB9203674.1 S41 family peptidase [Flavobacteriales bacterium]
MFLKALKKVRSILVVIPLVLLSFMMSSYVDSYFEISKNLDIFITLFKELNLYYVDDTQPGDLVEKGIDGMLESLDPYTTFIPESDIEDYRFMTTGQYGGIGALIRKKDSLIVVAEPYEDFPAMKAGLLAGDIILEVNGKSTEGKSTSDISEVLKGQPQTEVKVKIQRFGEDKPQEVSIVREEIQIKSVPYSGMLNDEVGYVNLSSFTDNCSQDVKAAVEELKGKGMKKLILDLRGNPGGLLKEAVSLSNLFVPKGELIVSTKGKVQEWNKDYTATQQPLDKDMPLAVLVNSGSASASEIVSGVIQDLDRGVVIGQRSYGKGLVQTTRPLSYNSQLKVTTAKYYIPSGRCIQALDYSNRNEDGSVGKVPDSLITQYATKAGRPVFDGGGINPDVELEPRKLSEVAFNLGMKMLYFDYATEYRYKNPTIAATKDFRVSDEMYEDFTKWLEAKEFDYTTDSERMMEKLKEVAEEEKYFGRIEGEYTALLDKVKHNKVHDLDEFKDEVKDLLRGELISRYYHQKGRIEAMLEEDPEVNKALEILSDASEYKRILSDTSLKE